MEEASAGNLFFQKQINWQSCGRKQLFYQNIAAVRRTSCDECIFKMQPREGGFYNTLQILCLSSRMFGCFSQSVEVTGSLLASSDLFKDF